MKRRDGVDIVAIFLAIALGLVVFFIVIGTIVQIFVTTNNPELSPGASQLLDSAITGIIGILGSYIGYSYKRKSGKEGDGHQENSSDTQSGPIA